MIHDFLLSKEMRDNIAVRSCLELGWGGRQQMRERSSTQMDALTLTLTL